MLTKLEQLSALRFKSFEEIKSVEEDIKLAQKVFEVETTVNNSIPLVHSLANYFRV